MAIHILDLAKELPPWVILGLGVITGGLRAAWSFLYEHTIGYAMTRVSISLTIEDAEHRDAYVWLSCWVEKNLRGRKVNSLLLRTRENEDEYGSGNASGFEVIPEYGTYYLLYKKHFMMVEHRKEVQPAMNQRRPMRSIRMRIWLSWDRNVILDILQEARASYEQSRSKRVDYFRWDTYSDWSGSTIPARPMASLFHPPALIQDLLDDVRLFLDSKQMYEDLGIPYRRGYLLAGPPGTGKSSLILAVASHFELPIYSVPLRGTDISGERLATLLANCRKPSLLALEDIDCLKVATSRKSKANDGLTIAELLNVVDGIGASEDRVLFMTANHPETLDYALTRAGRIDRKFYIDYARDEELKCFHSRIAQYHPVQPWPDFRAALPQRTTIADAQALALQGKRAIPHSADDRVNQGLTS
jgi:chaperone BCS1